VKRQHILSLVGVFLVLAASLAYLLGIILHVPVTGGSTTITVSMPRTGGLFEGSGVTYDGIVVGKVTDLRLTPDGVRATARLNAGSEIPRDSGVRVRSLSPIGEQYLDFRSRIEGAPYLRSGDEVIAQAVDLPATVAGLAITLDKLMSQVDPAKVRTVLSELSTGLSGAEDDLQQLTADSLTLIGTLADHSELIDDFLLQGNTLLRVGADNQAIIIAATEDFATFSAWLKGYQPQLTLERAPDEIEQLRLLVGELTEVLPGFLDAQGDLATILDARNPHVRAFLQDFPVGVSEFADSISNGRLQIDQLLRRGPYCDYITVERNARDTSYRPLQEDGHCSTALRAYSQRGTQFAPRPVD